MAKPSSEQLPDIRTVALLLSPLLILGILGLVLGNQRLQLLAVFGLYCYVLSLCYIAWLHYQQAFEHKFNTPKTISPPTAQSMAWWCLPLIFVSAYAVFFGNAMLIIFGAVSLIAYIVMVFFFSKLQHRYQAQRPMRKPNAKALTSTPSTTQAISPSRQSSPIIQPTRSPTQASPMVQPITTPAQASPIVRPTTAPIQASRTTPSTKSRKKRHNTVRLKPKGSASNSNGPVIIVVLILAGVGLVVLLLPIIFIGACFLQ
ncbi:hypothetical protein LVJ82_05975 [Vitreoscilla massiliensis]|uniref:Uncharacterized protein n=1 Tax=Vitreoscilla massiliensis TaxID=1689272 RepID=A0ABY4E415_9NEIS|nr:hypothetical protein [Vitreoscilla massiliensis]UOO90520.1 hypothetical protein LVJ82_05975 [Vitreoscilla massiliensis]